MTHEFDIIIAGGGMVGLTLACALAQRTTLSIAILEAKPPSNLWTKDRYHHRVSAVTLASKRIFQSLKIWDTIKNGRVSPFREIEVWDAAGAGHVNFKGQEIAEPVLGYIVENALLQTVLLAKVKHTAAITFIAPVTLEKFNSTADGVQITANNGEIYQARLAVAADGANSWLRAQANIDMDKQDYAQSAIVTTVETDLPHQQIARQVFLSSGPLAFLPLDEPHLSSIVWSLPTEEAKVLAGIADEVFKQELSDAFANRLGKIKNADKRHTFPLYKQQAKQYIAAHLALVGDAAHTVHPLAGQGVNMGLLDAASLVDVIVDALHHKRNFTSYATLRRYERWRKADNLMMFTGIDVIKNVFAAQNPTLQKLRTFGLNTTDRMQWVKSIFTRHAVGDRNGLPIMAQQQ